MVKKIIDKINKKIKLGMLKMRCLSDPFIVLFKEDNNMIAYLSPRQALEFAILKPVGDQKMIEFFEDNINHNFFDKQPHYLLSICGDNITIDAIDKQNILNKYKNIRQNVLGKTC